MGEPLMATEVAEQDFDRMCDAYDISRDLEAMEPAERLDFEATKRRMSRHIQSGKVQVDEAGLASVHVPGQDPIRFHLPTGAVLIEMSKYDDGQIARLNRAMQAMTKTAPGAIAKLKLKDFNVCAALAGLFLSEG